jgi:4-amino-4-deoxy-L-arabinose transferase-like glycosyltransferase
LARTEPSHRWLVLVLAGAAVLRFMPIWFGLPYEFARPDEEVALLHARDVLDRTVNPHFFHWPSLTFYLFAACLWVMRGVRHLIGLGEPSSAVDLLTARAAIATVGTATVAIAYALGRRVGNTATALTAAAFLAVAPLHVRDSHFAMTDVLATFFVTASLLLLLRAIDTKTPTSFAAAGFLTGLAASTKYTTGIAAASMVAAQTLLLCDAPRRWRDWRTWRPLAAFALASVAGFLLATPYAVLDHRHFVTGLTEDFTHLSEGHNGVQVGVGWTSHLTRSLPAALGWPMFLAAIAGLVPLATQHRRAAAILCTFIAVLYVSLGPGHTVFFRYVLPLVPVLCVCAAVAVRWTRVPLLALAVAAPALWTSVWSDVMLARQDTRVEAAQWLVDNVKPNESIYQAGSNYSDIPLGTLAPQTWPREIFDAAAGTFAGRGLPDWLVVPESPLGLYTTLMPSLRRVASEHYSIVHRVRATSPFNADNGVYDEDDAFFLPVTGFGAILRPGPTIVFYRRIGLH